MILELGKGTKPGGGIFMTELLELVEAKLFVALKPVFNDLESVLISLLICSTCLISFIFRVQGKGLKPGGRLADYLLSMQQ